MPRYVTGFLPSVRGMFLPTEARLFPRSLPRLENRFSCARNAPVYSSPLTTDAALASVRRALSYHPVCALTTAFHSWLAIVIGHGQQPAPDRDRPPQWMPSAPPS